VPLKQLPDLGIQMIRRHGTKIDMTHFDTEIGCKQNACMHDLSGLLYSLTDNAKAIADELEDIRVEAEAIQTPAA
jgi:hypothetical protein